MQEFLTWLDEEFMPAIPTFQWETCSQPDRVAVLVIDLVRGFCHVGPLASPRVEALVGPAADFLRHAAERGVQHIYYCCDEHPPDSPEFQAFPPHCVAGTAESELHPLLAELPFGRRVPKRSLNALLDTELTANLPAEVQDFILLGDCTDLCVYSAAMHLRTTANARGLDWRVRVLANLVDTYDLPLAAARSLGALPHPANLCHRMALYQMRLNGCVLENYSSISA